LVGLGERILSFLSSHDKENAAQEQTKTGRRAAPPGRHLKD
jgi:hypothetical protein